MLEYAKDEMRLIASGRRQRDRVAMLRMSLRLHLAARGRDLPGAQRELCLQLEPNLDLRLRRSDFILFEIFGLGGYDVDLSQLGSVTTVLDAGANIGLATIFLSRRLASARFVCVEPVPSSFSLLEHNLSANNVPATALHAAVAAEPGPVRLREGRNSMLARVVKADDEAGTTVTGMTIPEILDAAEMAEVDLAKIDIEGGERELFECLATWSDRVRAVLAEIHPPLEVGQAARQLSAHGFERLSLPPDAKFADLLLAAKLPNTLASI